MVLKNLEDLGVFIRIIDTGSFTAAARLQGLSPTTVSKQIARLEKALGVSLFERNTRSVRITHEGKAIAAKVRVALSLVDEAVEIANNGNEAVSGVIKITAPVPFGRTYVAAATAKFRELYPSVGFVLHLTDSIVDLYANDIDLAIRVAHLTDSNLVARRVADNRRILVASPDYLKLHGKPLHPTDLNQHQCLLFAMQGYLRTTWTLHNGNQVESLSLSSDLVADNGDALRIWCEAGMGIALREMWDVAPLIHSKRLVRVLPEWVDEITPINVVRAVREPVPLRIKRFVEFLVKEWKAPPWET